MDHDSFLNNLIEHSELYKNFTEKENFTEKDLKKFSYSLKDLMKLFMGDEQELDKIKKTNKTISKYFD